MIHLEVIPSKLETVILFRQVVEIPVEEVAIAFVYLVDLGIEYEYVRYYGNYMLRFHSFQLR